jgi:hypothetical protein
MWTLSCVYFTSLFFNVTVKLIFTHTVDSWTITTCPFCEVRVINYIHQGLLNFWRLLCTDLSRIHLSWHNTFCSGQLQVMQIHISQLPPPIWEICNYVLGVSEHPPPYQYRRNFLYVPLRCSTSFEMVKLTEFNVQEQLRQWRNLLNVQKHIMFPAYIW